MTGVLHLTTVHPRFDTRIFQKECMALHQAGHKVDLVVADGLGDAVSSGITIHDLGRVTGRLRRMTALPFRAYRYVRKLKPASVHIHDPELLIVALALRLAGKTVIYDAHEDLPRAILSKHWIHPSLRRVTSTISERVEDFCASRLSAVVAATPQIARRFERIQPETVVATNYPVLSQNVDVIRLQPQPRTVCYIGAISRKRSAREMIAAVALADARLVLAGPFEDEALRVELMSMPGWARVDYRGVVPHHGIWQIMNASLAGLLLFHPEPNHINAVPNKLFEYMAGQLPLICSDFESWRPIVDSHGVGLCCDPLDPEAIAACIRRIIDNPDEAAEMGRRGRETVMAEYRWENEAARLLALYDRLLHRHDN